MTVPPEQRTWPELLSAVLRRDDLSVDDAAWAMDRIMTGEATPSQVAGLAVALRAKGEAVDEIEGFVRSMYSHALLIDVPGATCGTRRPCGAGRHGTERCTSASNRGRPHRPVGAGSSARHGTNLPTRPTWGASP